VAKLTYLALNLINNRINNNHHYSVEVKQLQIYFQPLRNNLQQEVDSLAIMQHHQEEVYLAVNKIKLTYNHQEGPYLDLKQLEEEASLEQQNWINSHHNYLEDKLSSNKIHKEAYLESLNKPQILDRASITIKL